MSRSDAFSEGQEPDFQINGRRSVTIGSRTFPTVYAANITKNTKSALIATENGNLTHVVHYPQGPLGRPLWVMYSMDEPTHEVAHTPHHVHEYLDQMAQVHLGPDQIAANQHLIKTAQDWEDPGNE